MNPDPSKSSTTSRPRESTPATTSPVSPQPHEQAFAEVLAMIQAARGRALVTVNTILIDLYWRVGQFISHRIDTHGWGKRTVTALADYIQKRHPGGQGFSPQNLWRMRQFFEAYQDQPELSSLMRELPWTSNLHILTKSKRPEEREFYLRMSVQQRWSTREVARQIDSALFERAVLSPAKVSSVMRELHPVADSEFRDAYIVDFLALPEDHREADLHRSLLHHLRRFMAELGHDFCFIGSEVPLQVGTRDFYLDLLFFHRGLSCLVAIELKVGEFEPEHMGKLEFYLEALDRDVRKPHEGPSIGMLLCTSKNSEVVEYALSRTMSPALVAEYQTKLPDRELLQARLHEFYAVARAETLDVPEDERDTERP